MSNFFRRRRRPGRLQEIQYQKHLEEEEKEEKRRLERQRSSKTDGNDTASTTFATYKQTSDCDRDRKDNRCHNNVSSFSNADVLMNGKKSSPSTHTECRSTKNLAQDEKLRVLSSSKISNPDSSIQSYSSSTKPSPIQDKYKQMTNDDDDDDDDDDFFQLVKPKFRASKEDKPSGEKGASQTSPRANGIRMMKKGSSLSFSDDEERHDGVQSNLNSRKHGNYNNDRDKTACRSDTTKYDHNRVNQKHKHYSDDDDCNNEENNDDYEDDDDEDDRNYANSITIEKKKNARAKKSSRRDSSSSGTSGTSDDEQSGSEEVSKGSPKKARNPITVAKEQDERFYAGTKMNPHQSNTKSKVGDDDDSLWDDDCEPVKTTTSKRVESSTNKKRKTSHSSVKRKSDASRTKSRNYKSQENNDRYESDVDSPSSGGEDVLLQDTDTGIGIGLESFKPEFETPKFGPYEMEPLLLTNDNLNGQHHQVPASLNRYLLPFQKDGVRFLYECLSRKSGAILGDEMGCGKTIQIIALLCALFDKAGTGKDLQDIRHRKNLVRKHRSKLQNLKDKALCSGDIVVEDNIEEWKMSQALSPWHPVMIIVPPTICDTWKRAFQEFSHFSVSLYRGKDRAEALKSIIFGSADILLVPKSAFQDDHRYSELEIVKWKMVIIDEFHNFKNFKAKLSEHLRELKQMHQPLIIGMTGTPMQNNYTELWNIVDLAQTDYLGSREAFKNDIDRPITLGRQKGANAQTRSKSKAVSEKLRERLDKLMIKRRKEDVFLDNQIPEKNEQVLFCDLSPLQKEVYMHVLQLPDFELVKYGSRPCDCGINQEVFREIRKLSCQAERLEYFRTNKGLIIKQSKCCKQLPLNPRYNPKENNGEPYIDQDATIWRALEGHNSSDDAAIGGCEHCPWCCTFPCMKKLQLLSNHLGLLQCKKTKEAQIKGSPAYVKYLKEKEFAKVSLAGVVSRLPGNSYEFHQGITADHFCLSGKLEKLADLLENYDNASDKVLLFSHSTKTLDLIESFLRSRGTFIYLRMDGSTPTKKRQAIADEFNDNQHIFLFLLSTKAMGQGLNLTSANKVIMYDVDWNPSWEIQAQDRAHRIGQTRNVEVIRLVSKGCVEEMIYLRQIYKMHLKQDALADNSDPNAEAPRVFRGVQGDKHMKGEIFGTENIFRFKENGGFLDDLWSKTAGATKIWSGLKFHDSTKMAEVLLKGGDGHLNELENDEDASALQKVMTGQLCSPNESIQKKTGGNWNAQSSDDSDSDSDGDKNGKKVPLENKVRAFTHNDLLRSDKGRAAIIDGEDGFDEEMGGQSQAAFAIISSALDDDDEVEVRNDYHDELPVKFEFSKEKEINSTVEKPIGKSLNTSNSGATEELSKNNLEVEPVRQSVGMDVPLSPVNNLTRKDHDANTYDPVEVPPSTKIPSPDAPKRPTEDSIKNCKDQKKSNKKNSIGISDNHKKPQFSVNDFAIPDYGKKKKKRKKKRKRSS